LGVELWNFEKLETPLAFLTCDIRRRSSPKGIDEAPDSAPMKPSGPVMKIPSSGPWFASGVKINGPKNPPQKPSAPTTAAQERADNSPFA